MTEQVLDRELGDELADERRIGGELRPGEGCRGLVTDVRVQGTIETSEGRLGPQAVAVIPITIIATA